MIRKNVQRMRGYVPGEQPNDPGIVKLNTNENPYPPSPHVRKALQTFDAARLRLYPDPACHGLRDTIARLHGCAPEYVFVGNGSDEVLALCTRAFVEDDGTIGYFGLSYSLYPVLAEIRGVRKQASALGADFSWAEPDPGDAGLFFLTNPNAPTGVRYPAETVGDFCRRFRGIVVIDEAYVEFADGDCMRLGIEMDNVLVARTLSKSHSLAGLRVGYAVGAPHLIEALVKIKDSYNVDMLSQALARAALDDREHMLANIAKIKATRVRLAAVLATLEHDVTPSETNFLWVRPRTMTAQSVFEGLRARGILVRYFPGDTVGDYLRITVGTDTEVDKLIEALQTL